MHSINRRSHEMVLNAGENTRHREERHHGPGDR
jgi:hypothetical protein